MLKLIVKVICLSLIILLANTCQNIPDFPIEPTITFKKISIIKNGPNKSIILSLGFTDGDGDMGLDTEDTISPYQSKNDIFGNPTNLNYYNIFCTFLIEDNNSFKECKSLPSCSSITINSNYNILINGVKKDTLISESLATILTRSSNARYPIINTDGRKGPLSGTLDYNILISDYFDNKKIRIQVYIKDRSLNTSNVILTDAILVK